MIAWLKPTDPPDAFPPVTQALHDPDGLLCAGGDLRPERLLAAYRRGIFPWYGAGQPILWWSPDPRMVLYPGEFRVSRSLAKTLRNRGYRVSWDTCFDDVISHCADSGTRGAEGTWISREMRIAYGDLHRLGHAHSVEVWLEDQLVGGLYGLEIGGVFFGESMFSAANDASKVALHWLVQRSLERGTALIDCQVASEHLFTLGARLVPRTAFVTALQQNIPDAQAGSERSH